MGKLIKVNFRQAADRANRFEAIYAEILRRESKQRMRTACLLVLFTTILLALALFFIL